MHAKYEVFCPQMTRTTMTNRTMAKALHGTNVLIIDHIGENTTNLLKLNENYQVKTCKKLS